MKCLPASKMADCNGVGLHDWHAEILTIRTFNRHLLNECHRLMDGESSDLVEQTNPSSAGGHPFRLRRGVKLHMYASEAPCKFIQCETWSQYINGNKVAMRAWRT